MQSIHHSKVHLVGYNSPSLTITVCLHSFSCYCFRNTKKCREIPTEFDLTAVQGHTDFLPDSIPRLWRYINLLLTYLLTYLHKVIDLGVNGSPYVTSY